MFKAIVTTRELKNKATGIDLYVSDYQEIPHRIKNTFLYHVIVITNLFYYKSNPQRESDTVQFMISKSFEEFEEFYKKLYKRFPSVNFPSLPGRFTSNTTERLQFMDSVLKLVAKTQKLSSSPMLISFLKGNTLKSNSGDDLKHEALQENTTKEKDLQVDDSAKKHDNDNFEDVDIFDPKEKSTDDDIDDMPSTREFKDKLTMANNSLFNEEDLNNDDQDGDLFSPGNPRKSDFEKNYDLGDVDEAELLDSSDELDELLLLSKKSEKLSSIKVAKTKTAVKQRTKSNDFHDLLEEDDGKADMFRQSRSHSIKKDRNESEISDIFQKTPTSLFVEDDDDDLFTGSKIEHVTHDDIASYISQQEQISSTNASLEL